MAKKKTNREIGKTAFLLLQAEAQVELTEFVKRMFGDNTSVEQYIIALITGDWVKEKEGEELLMTVSKFLKKRFDDGYYRHYIAILPEPFKKGKANLPDEPQGTEPRIVNGGWDW